MRILLITRRLAAAGAERQLIVLAKGLRARGNDVHVAVFYRGGELEQPLREASIPIHALGKRSRWNLLAPFLSMVSLVRSRQIDVVYSFLPGENLFTALLKLLRPRTRVIWGMHSADRSKSAPDRYSRVLHAIEARLSRIPDVVLAVSDAAREGAIRRGSSPRNVVVVPNAIDVEEFRPIPGAGAALRRELGLPSATRIIGIVGRIVPVKDHPLFLRAAASLRQRRSDVVFAIVGDGAQSYVQQLRALEAQLGLEGAVHWAGARNDLAHVYSALDILALTSHSEGFGNVIGEAMACGTPCVATDVGAASALIGDTGRIVRERTPEVIAEAWESLLAEPRDALASRARARIVAEYAVDHVAARVERLFAGL